MEITIQAKLERNIISSQLLNENSLLVVSKDEKSEYPTVSVCYAEKGGIHDTIKEDRIASLTPTTVIHHNERIVAVFIPREPEGKSDLLITVYDLDNHTYVENDFLKTIYDMRTREGIKIKQLTASKL